jgi:hypothetical protein
MWTILLPIAIIATMNAFFAPLGFAPVWLLVENDDSRTPDSGL